MDPLSVIASIAGVATAGISLSRAIYDIISSVRNAPKEASDIARGLCDLSLNFRELRRVLKDGQDIYRRRLIKRVASAIKRVGRIQDEIKDLLDITEKGVKLRWLFRKSKIQGLLYAIESHKTGINMILQTMLLAVQLKQVSKDNGEMTSTDKSSEKEERWNDVVLVRQQAENMVQMSYHSIRELVSEHQNSASQNESEEMKNEDTKNYDVQRYEAKNGEALDSASWLYDVVFSAAMDAAVKSDTEREQSPTCGVASSSQSRHDSEKLDIQMAPAQAIVARRHDSPMLHLQTLNRHPPVASLVVDGLLSEWTTLTEAEIAAPDEGTVEKTEEKGSSDKEQFLKFTDAVGRKFSIPFDLVREWKAMESMIDDMFLHVDVLGDYVRAGNYDIMDAAGNIVLHSAWQDTVRPGEVYRMAMWPIAHGSVSPPAPKNSSSKGAGSPSRPKKKKTGFKPIRTEDVPLLFRLFHA